MTPGVFHQAARIDDDARHLGAPGEPVLPIASESRQIRDQRIARARHGIEQGRLAHIRSTDQCDYGQHAVARAITVLAYGVRAEGGQSAAVGEHHHCVLHRHRRVADAVFGDAFAARRVRRCPYPANASSPGSPRRAMAVLVTAGVLRPRRFNFSLRHSSDPSRWRIAMTTPSDCVTIYILLIDRQAAIARHFVRPPDLAGIEREHGRAALVSGGEHVVADHADGRIDVDQTVELGAPVRRGERRIPHGVAAWSSDTAITLPLSKPLMATSLAMIGIAVPRKLKRGTCCSTDHSSLPLLASKPCKRPSTERITTTFSLIAGADSSSEFTRVRHSSRPVAPSSARYLPLLEPTTTIPNPAAGPADSGSLSFLSQTLLAGIQFDSQQFALVRGREHHTIVDRRSQARAAASPASCRRRGFRPRFSSPAAWPETSQAQPAVRRPCPCCSRRRRAAPRE